MATELSSCLPSTLSSTHSVCQGCEIENVVHLRSSCEQIRKQKAIENEVEKESDVSSTKKRKKILVSRKDCPIHAKYRKGASIESIPEGNECRCRIKGTRIARKPMKKSSSSGTPSFNTQSLSSVERRPEPEGSCLPSNIDSTSYILNDYSLFSDCEDIEEDLDVREELEKLHSKYKGLFSVAYLLKPTSFLKFTLIGSELKNINCCLKRVLDFSLKFYFHNENFFLGIDFFRESIIYYLYIYLYIYIYLCLMHFM